MTKYLFLFIFLCINVSIINCSDKKHIEVEKNKINIISYKEQFAVILESQVIHDSFKSIFETMWISNIPA